MDGFIFPDDLQAHLYRQLHDERTESDTLRADDGGFFDGRISDVKFKGTHDYVMSFRLDGRGMKNVILSAWQKSTLDLGRLPPISLPYIFACIVRAGLPVSADFSNSFLLWTRMICL